MQLSTAHSVQEVADAAGTRLRNALTSLGGPAADEGSGGDRGLLIHAAGPA